MLYFEKAPFEPAQAAVVQVFEQNELANECFRFDHGGKWDDDFSDLALVVRNIKLMGTLGQALQDHGLRITRASFRPPGCTTEKLRRRLTRLFCQSPLPEHLHDAKEEFLDVHSDNLERFLEAMWRGPLVKELFAETEPDLVSV